MTLELERRYLPLNLPADLTKHPWKEVHDIYVPHENGHPTLRIRKNGSKHEITRKQPRADNPSEMNEETIPITETEFETLKCIPGLSVRKHRFFYPYRGIQLEIDVFLDQLDGLVVVEAEFDSIEQKNAFEIPRFCLCEVTGKELIAGGKICGKKYSDIATELSKLGYQPQTHARLETKKP